MINFCFSCYDLTSFLIYLCPMSGAGPPPIPSLDTQRLSGLQILVFQEGPSVIRERGERAERESTSSLTLTNSQSRVSSTLCSSKYLVQKLGWPVHLVLQYSALVQACSKSQAGPQIQTACCPDTHCPDKSYAPTFSREFLYVQLRSNFAYFQTPLASSQVFQSVAVARQAVKNPTSTGQARDKLLKECTGVYQTDIVGCTGLGTLSHNRWVKLGKATLNTAALRPQSALHRSKNPLSAAHSRILVMFDFFVTLR